MTDKRLFPHGVRLSAGRTTMGRLACLFVAIVVILSMLVAPVGRAAPATTELHEGEQLTVRAELASGVPVEGLANNQLIKIGRDYVSLADVQTIGKSAVYLRGGRVV